MNDSHVYFLHNARRMGKTTAMAEAAKKIGGYLIVRNEDEAERVRREHGCNALGRDRDLRGITQPLLIDPDAYGLTVHEYELKIHELKDKITKAEASLRAIERLAKNARGL